MCEKVAKMPGEEEIDYKWSEEQWQSQIQKFYNSVSLSKPRKNWVGRKKPKTEIDIEKEDRRMLNAHYFACYKQDPVATKRMYGKRKRWHIDSEDEDDSEN